MSNQPKLGNVFQELGREMRNHFSNTLRFVDHPLEVGLARERLLVEYLDRLIPERFGIGSGFVIDARGNRSLQIDVVIYDKIVAGPFVIPGHVHFFPCESVVAIGEVKSNIKDKKTLSDALEKIRSVQLLDRFSSLTNTEVAVHGLHGHLRMELKDGVVPIDYRILSFIFTSSALKLETMIDELNTYFSTNHKKSWPNLIASFDQYLIAYAKPTTLELFPDDASELYATDETEVDRIIPTFGALIANFLSVVKVVRPMYLAYLDVEKSSAHRFPICLANPAAK